MGHKRMYQLCNLVLRSFLCIDTLHTTSYSKVVYNISVPLRFLSSDKQSFVWVITSTCKQADISPYYQLLTGGNISLQRAFELLYIVKYWWRLSVQYGQWVSRSTFLTAIKQRKKHNIILWYNFASCCPVCNNNMIWIFTYDIALSYIF